VHQPQFKGNPGGTEVDIFRPPGIENIDYMVSLKPMEKPEKKYCLNAHPN
jgi:hypothetical protein